MKSWIETATKMPHFKNCRPTVTKGFFLVKFQGFFDLIAGTDATKSGKSAVNSSPTFA